MTFDTNADGSTRNIYAQLSNFNGFGVVDFDTRKEVRRIEYPEVPADERTPGHGGNTAHGIGVTPNNQYLVANSSLNSSVYVYTLPDLELVGGVHVGHSPNWVTITPGQQVRLHLGVGEQQRRGGRDRDGQEHRRDPDRRPGAEAQRHARSRWSVTRCAFRSVFVARRPWLWWPGSPPSRRPRSPPRALLATASTRPGKADRGEALYDDQCAVCHGTIRQFVPEMAALLGDHNFRNAWRGRTLGELFGYILETMPQDAPGTLTAAQTAEIVAHILRGNPPAGRRGGSSGRRRDAERYSVRPLTFSLALTGRSRLTEQAGSR